MSKNKESQLIGGLVEAGLYTIRRMQIAGKVVFGELGALWAGGCT